MPTPAYDDTNIFAKILRGELPCHKVYEDDVGACLHGHHAARRRPCVGASQISGTQYSRCRPRGCSASSWPACKRIALAVKEALAADGITILQYNEPAGGQVVFHLHFHILPRWKDVELRPHTGTLEKPEVLEVFRRKIATAIETV